MYWEKETLNEKKAFDSLKEGTNSFTEKWSYKICKPKEYFSECDIKLLELIQKEEILWRRKSNADQWRKCWKTQAVRRN